jgi:hypothetical protein
VEAALVQHDLTLVAGGSKLPTVQWAARVDAVLRI